MQKWKTRDTEIANSHMGHSLAAIAYNARAVSVLGYLGQLRPPPSHAPPERAALHHILHLPTNSWERNMFYHLELINALSFTSIEEYCRACMIRTANKTVVGWQSL